VKIKTISALSFIVSASLFAGGIASGQGQKKTGGAPASVKVSAASTSDTTSKAGTASTSSPRVTEIDANGLKKLIPQNAPEAKPLLVNFWATWCGPCREEFPDLVKLNAKMKDKGVDFITVSLDDVEDIKTKVPEFLNSMHAQMPAYLLNTAEQEDAIKAIDTNWGGSLPGTFLFNKKGEVVYKKLGPINAAELSAAIDKVASEK
jgi:thiol-disulfide isomerase/thioredoxin